MNTLENQLTRVILKKGREKSVKNFHPWIFSGAIDRVEGNFHPGDIIRVFSGEGQFVAKGMINPRSQIMIRVLTFQDESITEEFLSNRISEAYEFRQRFVAPSSDAMRVIHGDADYLSGLVVDQYRSTLVVQFFSLGMVRLKKVLLHSIQEIFQPEAIVERSEGLSLGEEGLSPTKEILMGSVSPELVIEENGIRYRVDVWNGQKTGFYLDQRDNRRRVRYLATGKKILNCFSYSGGFSIAAALSGASTTSVDVSESAQEMAQINFRLNGIDPGLHRFHTGNAIDFLSQDEENYDLIILDPPAFVKRRAHVAKGSRAYKEVNRLAMRRVRAGGLLLSCSCSSPVDWVLFQQILFSAAQESGRRVQIIARYGQPADHPVSIYNPEGEYLKTILLRVL